jgi:hypothetical protein
VNENMVPVMGNRTKEKHVEEKRSKIKKKDVKR